MMRDFTEREKAGICAGYKSGKTIRQLRSQYRCAYTAIGAVLDELSVARRSKNRVATNFTKEEKARIIAEYEQGATIHQLMSRYRRSQLTIVTLLHQSGVQRRPSGWNLKLPAIKARIQCLARERVGEKHPCWKGGVILKRGYKYIFSKDHPYRDNQRYVKNSRLVMEKKLGRFLRPEEVVHHINGNCLDDRLQNLRLFPDNGSHIKHHNQERRSRCL